MANARGIDIAYLYVADLERSIKFYEAAFGLAFERHGPDGAECALSDGGRFGFHATHPGEPPQIPGTVIVDLRVDDLDASRTRLVGLGTRVSEDQTVPTGRLFAFTDPDGYRLQVIAKTS